MCTIMNNILFEHYDLQHFLSKRDSTIIYGIQWAQLAHVGCSMSVDILSIAAHLCVQVSAVADGPRVVSSALCCIRSLRRTVSVMNRPTSLVERRPSHDLRRSLVYNAQSAFAFVELTDNTLRRSTCLGEVSKVQSLGISSRGNYPYFGITRISVKRSVG